MKNAKALWFGFSCIGIVIALIAALTPWTALTTGHIGLIMLALIVVAIMLGFPTAFTLMGMGVLFTFFAYVMQSGNPGQAVRQTLDLMVQRTYASMTNDSLISVPLFVFMGYLVERANLIEKLFRSLHLALARLPGSLAVATLATCAIFATATGIVGAVVTLMGLLAMPAMLKAGYSVRITAGSITAGGCLGILIPPSVLLIVYGATTGVSVVQLYAGAFFPGIMLAGLYVLYVMLVAKIWPDSAPPLSAAERKIPLPAPSAAMADQGYTWAVSGMLANLFKSPAATGVPRPYLMRNLTLAALPALVGLLLTVSVYRQVTEPPPVYDVPAELMLGGDSAEDTGDLAEPSEDDLAIAEADDEAGEEADEELGVEPGDDAVAETDEEADEEAAQAAIAEVDEELGVEPGDDTVAEADEAEADEAGDEADSLAEPPGMVPDAQAASVAATTVQEAASGDAPQRLPAPGGFWIFLGVCVVAAAIFYGLLNWSRLEVFKMLMGSFFPLAVMIAAVLGSIVFGLATPSEAAAMGALGGALLALAYRRLTYPVVRESVYLTAKTSAMVCWLFVGSSIFSAAFALLGGQQLIEQWVLSLGLTPIQFLLLAQVIIFLLGWPLEWTEIIVIFMPIFVPLLGKFGIDPLFFGLLVALNLQTAFLSPPVAMSAFYLKGVAPPHVSLNQIFLGMMPFMAIQILAMFLLYMFPGIGLWLPTALYR